MRIVTLEKAEYEELVWPAVHKLPAKDFNENRVVAGISKKLRRLGQPKPLSEAEQQAIKDGMTVFQDYAVDGKVTLYLEEEEWRLLRDRLRQWVTYISGYAAEMMDACYEKIDTAPQEELKQA